VPHRQRLQLLKRTQANGCRFRMLMCAPIHVETRRRAQARASSESEWSSVLVGASRILREVEEQLKHRPGILVVPSMSGIAHIALYLESKLARIAAHFVCNLISMWSSGFGLVVDRSVSIDHLCAWQPMSDRRTHAGTRRVTCGRSPRCSVPRFIWLCRGWVVRAVEGNEGGRIIGRLYVGARFGTCF